MWTQWMRAVEHGHFGHQSPPESPRRPLSLPKSLLRHRDHLLPVVTAALEEHQERVFGIQAGERGVFGERADEH